MKRLLATIFALSLVAGCGTVSFTAPNASLKSGYASLAKSTLKYQLGADLDGAPKIQYDETGFSTQAALPEKVDLRSQCPPVYNQGPFGSCTAFAIAKGLDEFILKKQKRHTELSALYLWYRERKESGWVNENKGAQISLGMEILDNVGCAPEKDHPYLPEKLWNDQDSLAKYLVQKPTSDEEKDGKSFRIAGHKACNSLHAIRQSVANGMPVVFGIAVYESFQSEETAKTGMVPIPTDQEKFLGGHAVLCVGYDNAKKVLIMRNSWGKDWGDKGYFYLPYEFIKDGLASDAWTAKI